MYTINTHETSKATNARLENHGQHKLGTGGYLNLVARIADQFNEVPTDDDLRLGFQHSFAAVVEC
jgi:hypothetical protein